MIARYRACMRIDKEVARRYLLGRQGLWPGRRWEGLRGTERAMRTMADVQLDPLAIVARAQDLALASRVIGYRPDDWMTLAYERRRFFEWGGWLALRPMDELPYYRVLMRRSRDEWWTRWAIEEHPAAVEEMRTVLRTRRDVGNRDFAMGERTRVDSYRGRKDSAVALHYLWRIGEAMVVRRERFERVYARAERVAPRRHLVPAGDEVADAFLLHKAVRAQGLTKLNGARSLLLRAVSPADAAAWKRAEVAAGRLLEVEVAGARMPGLVAPAAEAEILEALARGRVPRAWRPIGPTTTDEVTFLSPLEPVIHDRERTRRIFDFDYKWEVYDKPEKRRFGYYVLPILWGDRIVARADMALDRTSRTLRVKGFWLEDGATAVDGGFVAALRRGLERLARTVGAADVDRAAVTAAVD